MCRGCQEALGNPEESGWNPLCSPNAPSTPSTRGTRRGCGSCTIPTPGSSGQLGRVRATSRRRWIRSGWTLAPTPNGRIEVRQTVVRHPDHQDARTPTHSLSGGYEPSGRSAWTGCWSETCGFWSGGGCLAWPPGPTGGGEVTVDASAAGWCHPIEPLGPRRRGQADTRPQDAVNSRQRGGAGPTAARSPARPRRRARRVAPLAGGLRVGPRVGSGSRQSHPGRQRPGRPSWQRTPTLRAPRRTFTRSVARSPSITRHSAAAAVNDGIERGHTAALACCSSQHWEGIRLGHAEIPRLVRQPREPPCTRATTPQSQPLPQPGCGPTLTSIRALGPSGQDRSPSRASSPTSHLRLTPSSARICLTDHPCTPCRVRR